MRVHTQMAIWAPTDVIRQRQPHLMRCIWLEIHRLKSQGDPDSDTRARTFKDPDFVGPQRSMADEVACCMTQTGIQRNSLAGEKQVESWSPQATPLMDGRALNPWPGSCQVMLLG